MDFLRFLLMAFMSLSVSACAEETKNFPNSSGNSSNDVAAAQDSEFARMANTLPKLSGQTITLRGYLKGYAPALILVKNEESNVFRKPFVIIMDEYLRELTYDHDEFVDESMYLASLGCRDKFVELDGEVGFLPQYEIYGIININKITTYFDESFYTGSSVCYTRNE